MPLVVCCVVAYIITGHIFLQVMTIYSIYSSCTIVFRRCFRKKMLNSYPSPTLQSSMARGDTYKTIYDHTLQGFLLTALFITLILTLFAHTSNNELASSVYPPQFNLKNKAMSGGPFRVLKTTVKVGGYKCGGNQNAMVYYPDTSFHEFPLISFAHGLGAGGHEVDIDYQKLLVGISSWGFVVIATESAPLFYCEHIDIDQLRSIDYALTSDAFCFKHLARSSLVGVVGHSMGGQGTIRSAGYKNTKIGAAVALHPVYTNAAKNVKVIIIDQTHVVVSFTFNPCSSLRIYYIFGCDVYQVPILYGTGENDIYAPASLVYDMFTKTTVAKTFANMANTNHYEPGKKGHDRWTDHVAAFFYCHLALSDSACDEIYKHDVDGSGDGSNDGSGYHCPICECDRIPMVNCESEQI